MILVPWGVSLEWITPTPTLMIERAARTCYQSEPKDETSEAFVQRIALQKGHESVVEHACASFRIVCDRGVSHEIVRHRIASYSQESTRYCNYSKDKFGNEIRVVMPPDLTPDQRKEWMLTVEEAEQGYLQMLAKGAAPQIARALLPTCLKTELVMTTNFRSWMNFLKLRTSPAAHPQIRPIAQAIGAILANECPAIFSPYAR